MRILVFWGPCSGPLIDLWLRLYDTKAGSSALMWVQRYGPCPASQGRLEYAVLLQKTFFTGSVGNMCNCCVNSVLQHSVSIHGTEHIVLVLEPPLPAPHRLN